MTPEDWVTKTAGDGELAATLYVDIADPAALADRLAELSGVAATVLVEGAGK